MIIKIKINNKLILIFFRSKKLKIKVNQKKLK